MKRLPRLASNPAALQRAGPRVTGKLSSPGAVRTRLCMAHIMWLVVETVESRTEGWGGDALVDRVVVWSHPH